MTVAHVEVLVEEPSMEAALRVLLPSIWEQLERLLQECGYFAGGLRKIEAARAISPHMDPNRNRSASFRALRDALAGLLE